MSFGSLRLRGCPAPWRAGLPHPVVTHRRRGGLPGAAWPARPAVVLLVLLPVIARAGVVNPDISVIGQPLVRWTDDPANRDRKRPVLDVGETEFMFDAALNPYAHGTFIPSLTADGLELEEGYITLVRGLPLGLSIKGGKYRCGFGALNPQHPHVLPFSERPGVLAAYLPGDEAFNETGVSMSRLFPIAGEFSVTAVADWLQGDSFRSAEADSADPERDLTRPAFLGRLAGFTMLGEQSALAFGLSAAQGTNNVSARKRTTVLGVDLKLKLWTSPRSYLLLQGEALHLDRPGDAPEGRALPHADTGGCVFADYNFGLRYNIGASYERYQRHDAERSLAQAFGLFGGLSLLEETTAFRLDWNHRAPEGGEAVNSITLRVLYSMGPHKAHQF